MRIRLRGLFLLLFFFSTLGRSALAQDGLSAYLTAPDTSAFPKVAAYLDVKDAQRQFIHHLQPDQVSVLESGNTLPIEEIEELHPGVQFVVAINPGPAFAIRNFQAVSRYDLVKEALRNWAQSRLGTTTDDWSLAINDGSSISHVADPARFIDGLDADNVDARAASPSIDVLAQAVALASDPTPRPGMGKAILFITSSVDGDIEQAVKTISDQARQQNITLFVWMVASSGALVTKSAQQMTTLASETGGQVFNFSGEEILPSPEEYLNPLRNIYRITYQSKANLSGEHEFLVQIQTGEEQVISNTLSFLADVQPPEPAFIAPVMLIERLLIDIPPDRDEAEIADGKNVADFLFPKEVALQVIFDFPDGRKRDIQYSALLVDGVVVTENTAPPFDRFTWKVDDYLTDGVHQIQVQATDVLGLTGESIEVPVQVTVERLQSDPWFVMRRNIPLFSVILVVVIGALLFLALVLGGRVRPGAQRAASRRLKINRATNPISAASETNTRSLTGWVSRLQHPQISHFRNHPVPPTALAYLQHVNDSDSAMDSPPIPITANEVSIGSNPDQATLVLEDTSIEGLHARLIHEADGRFRLVDQGSIAGTWVNFGPLPADGITLQHGDTIHFGRMGFRFTFQTPAPTLKPNVVDDEKTPNEMKSLNDSGNPLETGLESIQIEQQPKEPTP